jgi:polar amino acid transport system substrate-binding protein
MISLNRSPFRKELLVLMAVFLLNGFLSAQHLTIYTEINSPVQFVGPDGKPTGLAVEVVQEIQRRTGNTDPITVVPWARGYLELQSRPNIALFSTARTAERNALFKWVGPLVETVFCFYVKSDSKITLKNLEDAKKLGSIGVYRNDARDIFLTKEGFTNLERTVENVANAKKLMTGRIDAFAAASLSVEDLMTSAGYRAQDIREALPFRNSQYFIAFSKETPDETVRRWNNALDAMKKDKSFERIYRKYYPHQALPGPAITSF